MFKTANRDQLVRNEEISAMKRELCMYISDGSDFQFLPKNTWGWEKGNQGCMYHSLSLNSQSKQFFKISDRLDNPWITLSILFLKSIRYSSSLKIFSLMYDNTRARRGRRTSLMHYRTKNRKKSSELNPVPPHITLLGHI